MKQAGAPHDFSEYSLSNSDTLLMALFIAAVVHVVVLLGINFTNPKPPKINKSIEVTLSHAPLKSPPKQASFLAPDHQVGAGDHAVVSKPLKENIPLQGQATSTPAHEAAQEKNLETKKPPTQKIIKNPQAPIKVIMPPETPETPVEKVEEKPRLSAEELQQQIVQLGERLRYSQQSSQDTKIKFVNSISTHKYLAAQYVKDWEDKVERTGNLNYPEAARHKGEAQMLTMDVGINADGSIYSMRIVRSSGNPALDDAAKRIVKMSAPFAALPDDLLHEVNVLVITRVWKFSDESGMTAR